MKTLRETFAMQEYEECIHPRPQLPQGYSQQKRAALPLDNTCDQEGAHEMKRPSSAPSIVEARP